MIRQIFILFPLLLATPSLSAQVLIKGSDGVEVTVQDITDALADDPADIRIRLARDGQRLGQIARSIFMEKRLEAAAQKAGYLDDPRVQTALERAKRKALAEITLDRMIEAQMPEQFDAAAEESYLLNQERYQRPGQVRASHILLSTQTRDSEDARQTAMELTEQLRKDVNRLAELVTEYSDDPTAESNQGNLGWFDRTTMVAPFSEAAFAAEEGDVTDPVRTQFGWHVIVVHDKRPAEQLSFESVKEQIISGIRKQRREEVRAQLTAELAADGNAEIFPVDLEEIEQAVRELE